MEADSYPGFGPHEHLTAAEYADRLFDDVSSALRDHTDTRATTAELLALLAYADERFQRLHDWVSRGNPLPEPWRKHFTTNEGVLNDRSFREG